MNEKGKIGLILLAGVVLGLVYVSTRRVVLRTGHEGRGASLSALLDDLSLSAHNASGVRYYRTDQRTAVRTKAEIVEALRQRGDRVVTELLDILEDPHEPKRMKLGATEALVCLLAVQPSALDEVASAYEHAGAAAKAYLAEVLARCDLEGAIPVLAKALHDDRSAVRVAAIEWLWRTEKKHKTAAWAVATLIGIATDEDRPVVERASALASLFVTGRPWVTPQAGVLSNIVAKEEDPVLREYAVRALGRLGPEVRRVAAVLRKAAQEDPSEPVRQAALEALERIGP